MWNPARLRAQPLVHAFVFALALSACGTGIKSDGQVDGAQKNPTVAFADARTVDGAIFDAAPLTGQDTVAWFWAPWCTICRGEAPEIARIAAHYSDKVTTIGIAGRGKQAEMAEFVSDTGVGSFTQLADLDGTIWSAFGIYGQPAFAFINDDGAVDVFVGSLDKRSLAERFELLINN